MVFGIKNGMKLILHANDSISITSVFGTVALGIIYYEISFFSSRISIISNIFLVKHL